jgi:hypothetical protein
MFRLYTFLEIHPLPSSLRHARIRFLIHDRTYQILNYSIVKKFNIDIKAQEKHMLQKKTIDYYLLMHLCLNGEKGGVVNICNFLTLFQWES